MDILLEYKSVFLIIHLIGVVLGAGGATISDILFFRFLKDFKISKSEEGILNTLSKVIWSGLILLFISGLLMYLPNAEGYNQSSKFLTKMVVVLVIFLNGLFLNIKISPNLTKIPFGKPALKIKDKNLLKLRRIAFASGAVSITSWYSALILGSLRSIPYTFTQGILGYFLLLIIVITFSQVAERMHSKNPSVFKI